MSQRPVSDTPMVAPSQWLILAMVIHLPGYAHDIRDRYNELYHLFAPTKSYADALRRLEALGLVTEIKSPPASTAPRGRGRPLYFQATIKGCKAHSRWLRSQVKDERWRAELLARIITAAPIGPHGLMDLIRLYEGHAKADARQVERCLAKYEDDKKQEMDLAAFAELLVLHELRLTLAAQRQFSTLAAREINQYISSRR